MSKNGKIRLGLHQQDKILDLFPVQIKINKPGRNREEVAGNHGSTGSFGSREGVGGQGMKENGSLVQRTSLVSGDQSRGGCVEICGCGVPAPSTKF
jgi:hypothetical protein